MKRIDTTAARLCAVLALAIATPTIAADPARTASNTPAPRNAKASQEAGARGTSSLPSDSPAPASDAARRTAVAAEPSALPSAQPAASAQEDERR